MAIQHFAHSECASITLHFCMLLRVNTLYLLIEYISAQSSSIYFGKYWNTPP